MAFKHLERAMILAAGLGILLSMAGCATTGPSEDSSMVILENPWKARKRTAGTSPPDPSVIEDDRRFRAIQGDFMALTKDDPADKVDDWVHFDGNGYFDCGPDFHPNTMTYPDGPPKGYLTGFYVVDGGVLHMAFCEGSFAEAHYQDVGTGNSISAIVFKGKTYRLKTASGARSSPVGLEEE